MNHAFQFHARETKSIHSTYIRSEDAAKDEMVKEKLKEKQTAGELRVRKDWKHSCYASSDYL